MAIEFRCQRCDKLLRTPDESAGKKAKCPECATIQDVPEQGFESPSSAKPFPSAPLAGPLADEVPDSSQANPAATSSKDVLAQNSPFSGKPQRPAAPASEPFNPYTAPSAGLSPPKVPSSPGKITPSKIDFGRVYASCWSILNDNLLSCVLAGAIFFGLVLAMCLLMYGVIVGIVLGAVGLGGEPSPALIVAFIGIGVGFGILALCLWSWLEAGIYLLFLKMAQGEAYQLSDIFRGRPYWFPMLGVNLVMSILQVGISVVFQLPGILTGDDLVLLGGSLLSYLPIGLITFGFLLGKCFIVDQHQGVFQAISHSLTYMKGNYLMTFLILLVAGLGASVGAVCTCGIGYLVVIPAMFLLFVVIYLHASGQATADLGKA